VLVFEVDVEDKDLVVLLGICGASSLSMYLSCSRA
ncbi:hypothetical protein L195_g063662, partial [Trifolium pratense]